MEGRRAFEQGVWNRISRWNRFWERWGFAIWRPVVSSLVNSVFCLNSMFLVWINFSTRLKFETGSKSIYYDQHKTFLSGTGCHLHIIVSDASGKTIGGHLLGNAIVRTTAEIVIGEAQDSKYSLEHDESTGFPELVVDKRSLFHWCVSN